MFAFRHASISNPHAIVSLRFAPSCVHFDLFTQFYLFIFGSRRRPRAILHHFMSALCNQPLPFSTIAVAAAAAAVVATTISERPVKKNIDEMGQMDSECFNIIHIENHSFRVFHFGYDLLTRN